MSGSRSTFCPSAWISGTIVTVYGMLSTIAEMKPLIHKTTSAARWVRPPVQDRTPAARSEMMPALTTAPTRMNKPMKKNRVGHSTVLKISCTSSRATIMRTTAPVIAMVAPSSPRALLNRKPRIVSAMTASEVRIRGTLTILRSSVTRRAMSSGSSADVAARSSSRNNQRASVR